MLQARILTGNCLDVMKTFEADSIDSIVTDPPYGLSFMGKEWDHGVPGVDFWVEALRVAKPGAYLAAFGGTRTYHRLTCAIEDAGWEIRDCCMWLYGSGFPKSLDVSKAIDKMGGVWRERAGQKTSTNVAMTGGNYERTEKGRAILASARQWEGFGTALKPAWEPIIIARKPLIGTVATNVLNHGTGALNIDGCRIACEGGSPAAARRAGTAPMSGKTAKDSNAEGRIGRRGSPAVYQAERPSEQLGRWPANLVLDEEAAALLDAQTDVLKSGLMRPGQPRRKSLGKGGYGGGLGGECVTLGTYGDSGGASRFFATCRQEDSAWLVQNLRLYGALTAGSSLCLQSVAASIVQSDVVTWALPEGTALGVVQVRFMNVTLHESRRLAESVIEAIQSIGPRCLRE